MIELFCFGNLSEADGRKKNDFERKLARLYILPSGMAGGLHHERRIRDELSRSDPSTGARRFENQLQVAIQRPSWYPVVA